MRFTGTLATSHQDNSPPSDIGPDEWFYWLVVVPVGRCPGGELS